MKKITSMIFILSAFLIAPFLSQAQSVSLENNVDNDIQIRMSSTSLVEQHINENGTQARVPAGSTVLHWRQSSFSGYPDLEPLLTSIGFTVTNSFPGGDLTVLIPSQPWDLIILQVASFGLTPAETSAIQTYIAGGGKVIMDYWALNGDPGLQAIMGISNAISFSSPIPAFVWDGAHPIFNTPNAVAGIPLNGNDFLGDNGDRLEPAPGSVKQ